MTNEPDEREKPAAAVTYYKVDSRGLSYGELWRLSHGLIGFLILGVMKLLGTSRKLGIAVPFPRRLVRLDPDQVPPRSAEVLRPAIAEWEASGLHLAFFYTDAAEYLVEVESTVAALLSDDGRIAAMALYTGVTVGDFSQEELLNGALSRMPDGMIVITTTRPRYYEDLPYRRVHYLTGRTIMEAAAHHRHRLRNIPLPPVGLTASALFELLDQDGERQLKGLVDRGVLVPMTAEEVEAERRRLGRPRGGAEPPPAPVAGRSESDNPYQSPAAQAASPEPAAPRPRALSWPWALLWLVWPVIFAFFSVFFGGDFPRSPFFLLIVMASNAGFVDSLYRRRLVRRPWVLGLIWVCILIGQMVAAVLALMVAYVFALLIEGALMG